MKKFLLLSIAIVFAFVVFMTIDASPAAAGAIPTEVPSTDAGPANGSWVTKTEGITGTEIPTASITAAPPNEWSRLQSNGFMVSGRTEICHPFRGGQFGWHTSIFLLEGTSWTMIPTTVEWYPDEEGQLMACAYAPVSGTYAMFGYWEWFEGFKTPEPEPFRQINLFDQFFN